MLGPPNAKAPRQLFLRRGPGRLSPGKDIRRRGEELARGDVLVGPGHRLGPHETALLAVAGIDSLLVWGRLRVALAVTGNEVISEGLPGPGEVRDAFSHGLTALLTQWGCEVVEARRLPDDDALVDAWVCATEADILLLTGGSGSSDQDCVRRSLDRHATAPIFSSVRMRPGHPTNAALVPGPPTAATATGPRLALALPGNPLAAYVAAHALLKPALRDVVTGGGPWVSGVGVVEAPGTASFDGTGSDHTARRRAADQRAPGIARATAAVDFPAVHHSSVRFVPCRPSTAGLVPAGPAQSHMLSGLASASVLAVIPPEGVPAGRELDALPLD